MMREILLHLAQYDQWANRRYVERLEGLVEDVLDAPASGSFPSLRATLLHIRDAENVWWCRINGLPYRWPASPEQGIRSLLVCSDRLGELVENATERDLGRVVEYHDLKGNIHRRTVWSMLLHCFNHSTQHRGQLITQLRILGVDDIPSNDLVAYQHTLV